MKPIKLKVKCLSSVEIETCISDDLCEKLITCYDNGYSLDGRAVIGEAVDVVRFLAYVCQGQTAAVSEFEIEEITL